jgi:serine/threonine protein kinase
MIDSLIGKYKIIRLIGEGGMASVYEAKHQVLNTRAAIKILSPVLTSNPKIRERFLNEARLMATLDHPNITKVIDFEEFSHQLYIIMEYLEGEELTDKIKKNGSLKDEEIENYFSQILSAFQYAHENGIVHRDIKPSNIFVLKNGQIKILDFGIAKLFGEGNESTQAGTQLGTPIYMSPEQVKSDRSIDHRSDIYSLGVTLYFAVTGKTPYDSNTNSQFDIYNKIVYEPLPNLPTDSKFSKIIEKACNKNRDLRYQTCSEWIDELKSILIKDKEAIKPTINKEISFSNPNIEKNEEVKNKENIKENISKKNNPLNNENLKEEELELNSPKEIINPKPIEKIEDNSKSTSNYFYSENGKSYGPFSLNEILVKINPNTIVSTDEISWKKATEFSEINKHFANLNFNNNISNESSFKSKNKPYIIVSIGILVISIIFIFIHFINSEATEKKNDFIQNLQDTLATLNTNNSIDSVKKIESKNDGVSISGKVEEKFNNPDSKSPLVEYYNKKDVESKYEYLRDVIFINKKKYFKSNKTEYEKILLDVYNHLNILFNKYINDINKINDLCNFKDDLNSEIKYLESQDKIDSEVEKRLNEKCNN